MLAEVFKNKNKQGEKELLSERCKKLALLLSYRVLIAKRKFLFKQRVGIDGKIVMHLLCQTHLSVHIRRCIFFWGGFHVHLTRYF